MALARTLGLLVGLGLGSACTGDDRPCPSFHDESSGAEVVVTLRNDGDAPVYVSLTNPCSRSVLTIRDPQGWPIEWQSDGWLVSCESLIEGEASCGGPLCRGGALRIEPGAQWAETWPGRVFDIRTLPGSCAGDDPNGCGPGCAIERTPTAGRWTFEISTATEVSCGTGACTTCDATSTPGACIVSDLDVVQPNGATPVTAAIDYPERTAIEFSL